jgi:GTP-binding protein
MANIVAIVGRPNVGKSTLFNRLIESREAIVEETSGVTRDRHYGKCEWNAYEISVIDTGGYIKGSDDIFEEEIRKQVELAVEEANVILFMVDVTSGILELDKEVAQILRKSKKEVIVVANKVDNNERIPEASEFYSLGLGEVFCISSASGSGTGDLLDEVVKYLNKDEKIEIEDIPRFSIIGRPNVGKSSLLNALIGQERQIVTDIAGTTRDSIYTRYKHFGFDFFLVDTAGIRKKGKVKEDLEFYSVMRSIKAIESCDVCLLVVDAKEGFDSQDVNLFFLAEKNKKGIVVLVNKWDLVEKTTNSTRDYEDYIKSKISPFSDVPILFISALTKQRIYKAIETAVEVYKRRTQKISTSLLNDSMLPIIEAYPPPSNKGKYVKIKYITQLPTKTPAFAFFCNLPQYVKEPYKRYLENKFRELFKFNGVPLSFYFRQK